MELLIYGLAGYGIIAMIWHIIILIKYLTEMLLPKKKTARTLKEDLLHKTKKIEKAIADTADVSTLKTIEEHHNL
jgi:short subunit fatty acids transporter